MLQTIASCPKYDSTQYTDVPVLDSIAVDNGNAVTIFAVNRCNEPLPLSCRLRGFADFRGATHTTLAGPDRYARNTQNNPDAVKPRTLAAPVQQDGQWKAMLPPLSWNVLRLI